MLKIHLTIRQLIMLSVILLVVIPNAINIYVSFENSKKSIKELNAVHQKMQMVNIKNGLKSMLSVTKIQNIQINELIKSNIISLKDKDDFWKTLFVHLRANPRIMSIEYSDNNRESIGVARDLFNKDYAVGISGVQTNNIYNLYAIDNSIDTKIELKDVIWKLPDYNPTTTPWYSVAKKLERASWTPIYLWPNGDFGLDYVTPLFENNSFLGVVDTSIKLPYLQDFVNSSKLYSNSQVFLLEKNGMIVAGTDVENTRTLASNSRNKVLRDCVAFLKQQNKKLFSVDSENSYLVSLNNIKYLLTVAPYSDELGIDWIIISATSEKDLLNPIMSNTKKEIVVSATLFLISIICGFVIMNYIINPISDIVKSAIALSKGNYKVAFDTKREDEIGTLANAISIMKNNLLDNIQSIKYETSLFSSAYLHLQKTLNQLKESEYKNQIQLHTTMLMQKRSDSILKSVGEGVIATDENDSITLFNKAATEITGISSEEAFGKNYKHILTLVNDNDDKPCTQNSTHCVLRKRDGSLLPISHIITPIINGGGVTLGTVIVLRNTSKERQIDKAKTEFVSLASHQLRTPLSTINWYVEMLLANNLGMFTPKQNQYLNEVYNASKRMVRLVNSILNVSRLELGTFMIEPRLNSIIEIVKACVNQLTIQVAEKNITISQIYDDTIVSLPLDEKLLSVVIQNLISNSIKYSNEGGKIEISIKKEGETLLITVSDTGIGIPLVQQIHIFEKLFRADNAKLIDSDGSGLGLYIAKEVVEHSGGKIWFISEEGKGTTFFIQYPLTGMERKKGDKYLS